MYLTESELRELWRDGKATLPAFPAGTRLSPAAQDFLRTHALTLQFEAAVEEPAEDRRNPSVGLGPEWDRPGTFPVDLAGPAPTCSVCGQPIQHKPDHMAQMDAGHYAPKISGRLRFRGRLDSLHGLALLCSVQARRFNLPDLAERLSTVAAYCRELLSAEYNGRRAAPLALEGKTEEELHQISLWPDRHLGMPHIVPGPEDHEILLWLNWLRTQIREVELLAYEVFARPDQPEDPTGIAHGLNRLSSAVYYLELLFRSGRAAWRVK